MLATNFTNARENFKAFCDKISDEAETLIVTRKGDKNIVMMSIEEYTRQQRAVRNAAYLEKIDHGIADAKAGNVIVKTMDELEAMTNQ